ncbi:MAG: CoA pyrophosphatase [Chloroflexia bacterium]|nr:CoA pyrophosphatase [Chloroflexia bacterium]
MTHPWQHTMQQITQHDYGVKPHLLPMLHHRDGRIARINHPPDGVTPRAAAVLILMMPNHHDSDIVLTRRGGNLRHHGGEIAFPGGKVDYGETVETAALREAEEELGIAATTVTVMGTLHTIYVPRSNHMVTPVVAWCDTQPHFVPNPTEVAEVFVAPLRSLLVADALCIEERPFGDEHLLVPYFLIHGYRVWGATALMLCDLLARIRAYQMQTPPSPHSV